ncbi:MAG: hypothetical protein BroJett021_28040 [Chloroflexota bacterium]|nr:MAG: hypothetical protein BroJett021_28040 [Chloroflexota bacterium]
MAIAGGACSAYWVRYDADRRWLHVRSTTALRSECPTVEEAIERLHQGEQVTVAGSDMAELRRRMHPDEQAD